MLPFLKNGEYASVTGEDDPIKRKSDSPEQYDILNAVAEDIIAALEHRNAHLLKDALHALVTHIQDLDQEQDAQGDENGIG